MSSEQQAIGKQITFAQLFEEFASIQIPIIQRDFAQGRKGQEELRSDFLTALKAALDQEEGEITALDLDFVYGSAFDNKNSDEQLNSFAPLDGQQRLTTLFLLHWYLAWADDHSQDFRNRFLQNEKSLFAYEVRPSSHDFFNRLAQYHPDSVPLETPSVAGWIQDSSWFYRSWKNDPTILSSLTILDEIHKHFRECQGFYSRITESDKPRITFQLLELRNFGLSDDLYIKMNARGKPLTPFENFKARLEQHLDEILKGEKFELHGRQVEAREYFSHQMDTRWTDLFWDSAKNDTHVIDDRVMRLIHTVALTSFDPEDTDATQLVATVRVISPNSSFSRYRELGCLTANALRTLITLLDYWSTRNNDRDHLNDGDFDTNKCFTEATNGLLSYPELVKFGALSKFLVQYGANDDKSLQSWMRVVYNLVENTDVERSNQLVSAISAISGLTDRADSILEYLATGGDVKFFYNWQITEERIKAALILKGNDWYSEIRKAERHRYFNGQIEFLLDFSGVLGWWNDQKSTMWTSSLQKEFHSKFRSFRKKSEAVFGPRGLKNFDEHLWERALLCEGDYTLPFRSNHCLLQNTLKAGNNKQPSWKTLLRGRSGFSPITEKRNLLKALFDFIDLSRGVKLCLQDKIQSASIQDPWREMLVQCPAAIKYCKQRMIRRTGSGTVLLISKQRTSSKHMELWSFFIYEVILKELQKKGVLKPFVPDYIEAKREDYPPAAKIYWPSQCLSVKIDYINDGYRFALSKNESAARERVFSDACASFVPMIPIGWDEYSVPIDGVVDHIIRIAEVARNFEVNDA